MSQVEILIIEDNKHDAELTIRALKKSNIINNIYIAEDGQEGLDFLFCKGKFESHHTICSLKVVFLDLKLPKMSGLEVLKEIKNNPVTKKIPVVILTSSREDLDIKSAYELGANCYVVKPLEYKEFDSTIRQTGLFWLTVNETVK